jgi:hypothetical protein
MVVLKFTLQPNFTAMPNFIVNTTAQSNGIYDVHDENAMCQHIPSPENRRSLGWFSSSQTAVDEAKKTYGNVKECRHCAKV